MAGHHITRYGASVRFSRATCEDIFTPSFEIDRSSADEGGLDDRDGRYGRLRRISFPARRQPSTEARGGRTKTGSRIEIAITTAIT